MHPFRKGRSLHRNDEVEVIRHEAVREAPPGRLRDCPRQHLEETEARWIVQEHFGSAVPARSDVKDPTGDVGAWRARHGTTEARAKWWDRRACAFGAST
jgi:hypothetical protein